MNTITSRTSNERIIRTAIFMVLVDVFTVMYLWDGYIGYPQQNRAELARVLGVGIEQIGPTHADFTASLAYDLRSNFPKREIDGEPSIVHDGHEYFVGPGGWLRVEVGHNDPGEWFDGPRTESDIRWQRYIGYTLAVVGVFATLFFARVLATRAVLSDAGLQITGKPIVRYDAIRALRADPRKRGVVEVDYESNGSRHTLRLDDYLYKDLARITAEIASKKGLNDPLAALQKA